MVWTKKKNSVAPVGTGALQNSGGLMKIEYHPIGMIHTPFSDIRDMPIQPTGAKGVLGTVRIFSEFKDGLADLDGFSHVILIYHFHAAGDYTLSVTPFLDQQTHGLFATRAPARPNPVGISIVKLNRIDGETLHIENVDMLDNTPLIDIKPYVPAFDRPDADRIGWLEGECRRAGSVRSDDRFG